MDTIEFSKALFSEIPLETSLNSTKKDPLPANNTTSITAEALSDSMNGTVLVLIESPVEVETTVSVKEGDICIITITGNTPIVTGVIAGGDRVMDSINELLLKRSTNLLDLSKVNDFVFQVANEEAATSFVTTLVGDTMRMEAVEAPFTVSEEISPDIELPAEDATGNPIEAKEKITITRQDNENSFLISTANAISLSGGYVLNVRATVSGIKGDIVVQATHDGEVRLYPTGEEGESEPETEIQTIFEDLLTIEIPEEYGDEVEVNGRIIFEAGADYSFTVKIGDEFEAGNVRAEIHLDLEAKEFIDASGAIARATEIAESAGELAGQVGTVVDGIKKEFNTIKGNVEEISGTINGINETTKPVLDAIEEVKGESESFKDGLTALIDSTAKDKYATKNDILEYLSEFSSNITQTASRIEMSVTEDDLTDILPEAEDSVARATEKYLASQTQYQNAQNTYVKAVSDNAIALSTLEEARRQYLLVEDQVNLILSNENISPTDKATAQKIMDDALKTYQDAETKYESIQTLFGEIESDLAQAKAVMDAAYDKLLQCRDSHSVSKAELNVLSDEISMKVSQTTYDADMNEVTDQYTSLSQTASQLEIDFASLLVDQMVLKYIRFEDGKIILGDSTGSSQVVITNSEVQFMQGNEKVAYIQKDNLFITRVKVTDQLEVNNWKWKQRTNGNISFRYIG